MIKMKIDINQSDLKFDLGKALDKAFMDASLMSKIGEEAKRLIYGRVKRGYGVNSDDLPEEQTKEVKLKPLSASYIRQRKGDVEFTIKNGDDKGKQVKFKITKPTLGPIGSPARSNLTFTGDMLESMKSRGWKYTFHLYFVGQNKNAKMSNNDLAVLVSKDRPFFALTRNEAKVIGDMFNRELRIRLKKYLK